MGEIVKNMTFSVYAGEITCMAGLIGSGRTEVMKIVAGAMKRNLLRGGSIFLDGRPVRYRVPAQAMADGIVYVTEDRKLNGFFETMSIEAIIYMGWLAAQTNEIIARKRVQSEVAKELRLADGPDEVHRNQIARLELKKYTPLVTPAPPAGRSLGAKARKTRPIGAGWRLGSPPMSPDIRVRRG